MGADLLRGIGGRSQGVIAIGRHIPGETPVGEQKLRVLGYMGITETGEAVLPPFVSRVSWGAVAVADGVLALVFGGTIAALALLYGRLAVHRALRMGEL